MSQDEILREWGSGKFEPGEGTIREDLIALLKAESVPRFRDMMTELVEWQGRRRLRSSKLGEWLLAAGRRLANASIDLFGPADIRHEINLTIDDEGEAPACDLFAAENGATLWRVRWPSGAWLVFEQIEEGEVELWQVWEGEEFPGLGAQGSPPRQLAEGFACLLHESTLAECGCPEMQALLGQDSSQRDELPRAAGEEDPPSSPAAEVDDTDSSGESPSGSSGALPDEPEGSPLDDLAELARRQGHGDLADQAARLASARKQVSNGTSPYARAACVLSLCRHCGARSRGDSAWGNRCDSCGSGDVFEWRTGDPEPPGDSYGAILLVQGNKGIGGPRVPGEEPLPCIVCGLNVEKGEVGVARMILAPERKEGTGRSIVQLGHARCVQRSVPEAMAKVSPGDAGGGFVCFVCDYEISEGMGYLELGNPHHGAEQIPPRMHLACPEHREMRRQAAEFDPESCAFCDTPPAHAVGGKNPTLTCCRHQREGPLKRKRKRTPIRGASHAPTCETNGAPDDESPGDGGDAGDASGEPGQRDLGVEGGEDDPRASAAPAEPRSGGSPASRLGIEPPPERDGGVGPGEEDSGGSGGGRSEAGVRAPAGQLFDADEEEH